MPVELWNDKNLHGRADPWQLRYARKRQKRQRPDRRPPDDLRETEMSVREQGRRKATAVSAHGAQPSAAAAKRNVFF